MLLTTLFDIIEIEERLSWDHNPKTDLIIDISGSNRLKNEFKNATHISKLTEHRSIKDKIKEDIIELLKQGISLKTKPLRCEQPITSFELISISPNIATAQINLILLEKLAISGTNNKKSTIRIVDPNGMMDFTQLNQIKSTLNLINRTKMDITILSTHKPETKKEIIDLISSRETTYKNPLTIRIRKL